MCTLLNLFRSTELFRTTELIFLVLPFGTEIFWKRCDFKFAAFLKKFAALIKPYWIEICTQKICDPWCQNETLLCTWWKLSYWHIISKVYIFPFMMIVKILKLYDPKGSYAHLTIGVLKRMKLRNRLSKFAVYHGVNGQLGQKSSKLHYLSFKFWSNTFTDSNI